MKRDRGRQFGLQQHVVTIIGSTEYDTVMVRDAMGQERELPLGFRPKGTAPPQTDEQWLMERVGNGWRLVAMMSHPEPPEITGPKAGADPIALQLLEALAGLGYVKDSTT